MFPYLCKKIRTVSLCVCFILFSIDKFKLNYLLKCYTVHINFKCIMCSLIDLYCRRHSVVPGKLRTLKYICDYVSQFCVKKCNVLNACSTVLMILVVLVSILMEILQVLRVHHALVHHDQLLFVLED